MLPLSRNADLSPAAQAVAAQLRQHWNVEFDDAGAIGRRYRRQDEIGTPYCLTVDFDTLEDQAVTIRDRDSMSQERVALDKVRVVLRGASPRVLSRGRAQCQMPAPLRSHVLGIAALSLAVVLVLTGCAGGDDDGGAEADESASPLPTPSTTLEVPEGTTLTAPGTSLDFGQAATVAYEVKDEGTLLDLTVNSAREGSLDDFSGFDLQDKYQRQANYYYVRVTVKNSGEKAFGGVDVPLWGISGNNTLLPPVKFTSAFATCPTEPLPKAFKPGDKFTPASSSSRPTTASSAGVSYRPTEEFVPIEWHGKVEKARPARAARRTTTARTARTARVTRATKATRTTRATTAADLARAPPGLPIWARLRRPGRMAG